MVMLLIGSVIVVNESTTLIVLSVATTLVSILIVMLNTLRLVLNAWISLSRINDNTFSCITAFL